MVSFVHHSGFLRRFRRPGQLSGMETLDTSNGEAKLSYSQAVVVMSFVRYSSTSVVSSLFQPALQTFAYLSFLYSSALIILRM